VGKRTRHPAFPFGRHDASPPDVASSDHAAFSTRLAAMSDSDDRAALSRLEAHSRRIEAILDRVDGGPTRAWIATRAALRRLRGRG
jgi:hypothetical protein